MKTVINVLSSLVLACTLVGCGGDSPTGPTPPPPAPAPTTPPALATITIAPSGVDLKAVTVSRGTVVTIVNNSGSPMDFASNPHPIHTDCPELNLGVIANNESRQTPPLNTARVCGYHDHSQPGNAARKGTITIQ